MSATGSSPIRWHFPPGHLAPGTTASKLFSDSCPQIALRSAYASMSILRDFEKRLEGAVEGFFARAFRSGLQPIELAKAIQRYASNYQQVGIDGVLVPNVYRFALSPEDTERFSGFAESLRRELADVVEKTAVE